MAGQKPLYAVLGTRAQLIKMAPILMQLAERGLSYRLIYTGQHRETIRELLDEFDLPEPDVTLTGQGTEATTKGSFACWFLLAVWKVCTRARSIVPRPGLLLTHGDTVSTLLGALLGRFSGCTVVHVESGLRSFDVWNPFPEELCRLMTFALAHHYLCPDEEAASNLSGRSGKKVVLGGNTLYDAVCFALERVRNGPDVPEPYAVASIHRYENVFNRDRFEHVILAKLREAALKVRVILVLHPVTRRALTRYGLWEELRAAEGIQLCDRMGYCDFIRLLRDAEFVVTDGGSNQEELSYLGVPCLLLRAATERREGLGQNVVLSGFDERTIDTFLQDYGAFATSGLRPPVSPTRRAVDAIMTFAERSSGVGT